MPTYIVLLRGINITGHKIIRMADLQAYFAGCGATNVRTYIQSGNVVCEHRAKTSKALRRIVEEHLAGKLGYRVTAMVLSAKELFAAAAANPYDVSLREFGRRMHVCFFEKAPTPAAIKSIQPYINVREQLIVKNSAGYTYHADGLGRAKLSHAVIERKCGPTAMRNWNTVTALLELAGE
ncbi:MAG TPA: DUF1697 domain-containing protein [Verrucomicrobiae bacterium]|nr:DUF1697 domain-containing protein [Verrucomicrobiae bacterium]